MHLENAIQIQAGQQPPEALGIRAVDDVTLQITLTRPLSTFLSMLVHPSLMTVNPRVIARFGDKWTQPGNFVSSGAYTLQRWVVNERLEGVRNPVTGIMPYGDQSGHLFTHRF